MSLNSLQNTRQNVINSILTSNIIPEHITKVYIDDTLSMVRSLILYNEDEEYAMGLQLQRKGIPENTSIPSKYRHNLNGEYYRTPDNVLVDTLMTIDNKDTVITITKDMSPIEEYYVRLNLESIKSRYPLQEVLLNGILNPIPFDKTDDVPSGTILYVGDEYIEEREDTLLDDLQKRIYLTIDKQHVEAYRYTDDLYPGVFWSDLIMRLPAIILNLRQARTHTSEVHSFHMTMYLESFAGIGKYVKLLEDEQSFWLYRNLRNLKKNSGSSKSFDKLVNILYDFHQFTLYGYNYRKDRTLEEMRNLYSFPREELTKGTRGIDQLGLPPKKFYDLISYGDTIYKNTEKTDMRASYSNTNHLKTKLLLSSLSFGTEVNTLDKEQYFIDYWGYLTRVQQGSDISGEVTVEGGITMPEHIESRDAYILYSILAQSLRCPQSIELTTQKQAFNLYIDKPIPDTGADPYFIEQVRNYLVPIEISESIDELKSFLNRSYNALEYLFSMAKSVVDTTMRQERLTFLSNLLENPVLPLDIGDQNKVYSWKINHSIDDSLQESGDKETLILALTDTFLGVGKDIKKSKRYINSVSADAILTRFSSYNIRLKRKTAIDNKISLSYMSAGILDVLYTETVKGCLSYDTTLSHITLKDQFVINNKQEPETTRVLWGVDTIKIGSNENNPMSILTDKDNSNQCLDNNLSTIMNIVIT